MKCYFGKDTACSDCRWNGYMHINNFGFFQDVGPDVGASRPGGRADWQIIVITDGKINFTIDSKRHTLGAGSCVLYRPGQAQKYEAAQKSSYFWVHFSGTEIPGLLERMKISETVFHISDTKPVIDIWGKMLDCSSDEDSATDDLLNSLFINMLSGFGRKTENTDVGITKVIQLMKKEGFKGLSLSEYAEISGLSQYHFIRKFKKHTRLTPHQYKARIITERAINLLESTNLNISEISQLLGFEDSLYFSRFFKKHTGVSPSDYKR